ncbi:hypothetical protein MmiAt1_10340 [Methanimicrococcus sp. At1]|uniref:Phage protein n=1 Tax=Methanimicrococcus hacksteinii TaxID=3028293 RepID=A0ABU3VPX2_9EURY|nr:hypothetical protein [Methanimicrococcus sp. At1]MDV0445455.1 hypothetical protein [Methanimicrococcus sp. At1]
MEMWTIFLAVIFGIIIAAIIFFEFILEPYQKNKKNKEAETSGTQDIPDHVCNYDGYIELTNDFTRYYCTVCGKYRGTYHDYYDGDPRDD